MGFVSSMWSRVATLFFIIEVATSQETICTTSTGEFHVRVDLFASKVGLYQFEECGEVTNPVLGLVVGQRYSFVQRDRTNFFHPIAFAQMNSTFLQGTEKIDEKSYQLGFVQPAHIWQSSKFSVQVDISSSIKTIGYYCSIHHSMEGKIRLFSSESELTSASSYNLELANNEESAGGPNRSSFDELCGTTGLEEFRLPNVLCPDRFVCGTDEVAEELRDFASCLDAANCAMMSGMTTGVKATADTALFIHQMIPHHENAVNTAKTLLKTGNLLCPDLSDQANPDCVLESILYEIIAGQNHQIQLMQNFLRDRKYPQTDNCDVFVETVNSEFAISKDQQSWSQRVSILDQCFVVAGLFIAMLWT